LLGRLDLFLKRDLIELDNGEASVFDLDTLCVPNIRFSMDAENRRGKFAT
jgi:hypothetical protein